MTDKDRSPDQIIHAAIGLCCHKRREYMMSGSGYWWCADCQQDLGPSAPHSPDYSKDLRPVFEWMQGVPENNGTGVFSDDPRWYTFEYWLGDAKMSTLGCFVAKMKADEQRDLIAQWIESTRE